MTQEQERAEIISRFNKLSLGDSLLQRIEIQTGKATCWLEFDSGRVLKARGDSIFEPNSQFAPALLRLEGVRSIKCDGGHYQLNSTVVDFGAVPGREPGYIEFYIELTGGTDSDAFMVKVKFEAKDFDFGPLAER